MRRRLELHVNGRVQGVCYRAFARDAAAALGLDGWVRNRPDGSVELLAEGEAEALATLVKRCQVGPPAARVDRLTPTYTEPRGDLRGFHITR
jgi:acylphosphatase